MSADHGWRGTDETQEATPHRLAHAEDRMEKAEAYAIASATHLWVIMLSHLATDVALDQLDGKANGSPVLDVDTMLGQPMTGCYVCCHVYDPRLRRRKCPGPPPA